MRARRLASGGGGAFSAVLLAGSALGTGAWVAPPVLPTGGIVAAGQVTVGAPSGGALTITQGSSKAIIDWAGFSIGQAGACSSTTGRAPR